MSEAAVVSSVPEGSARTDEWRAFNVLHNPGGVTRDGCNRSGNQLDCYPGSSNWGLGGEAPAYINYRDMAFSRIRQGVQNFGPQFNWVVGSTAINPFNWRIGQFVFEWVGCWPTDTAAVDNGVQFVTSNFQRVVTQAQAGFEIWNNNGVLTFTVQGGLGRQDVVLSPGVGIREPMKFRVEMRNQTSARGASLIVLVNDIQQVRVSGAALPVPTNVNGWFCNVGVLSATEYFYWRDLTYYHGPDTTIGM